MHAAEINQNTAASLLNSIAIPPCPNFVLNLLEESRKPDVNFRKVIALISGDVCLAAAMMKSANSPYFGLRTRASSVQQAVSILGLKNILQIVTELSLRQSFGDDVSMLRFWDRSNYVALVSSRIARRISRQHQLSQEEAYTYGLFHDCGIPILMRHFPDYKERLEAANNSADLVIHIEDRHYNTNHAVVGRMLAHGWFLPDAIVTAIGVHHDFGIFEEPEEFDPKVFAHVAINLIAEHIVASFLGVPDDAEWASGGKIALGYLDIDHDELEDMVEDALLDLEESSAYRS